ncbi:amidohydrolase [Candidatus Woesearchaeota archaeon]|nr:amidohydrolase [Candidatus Woesearchaeota archaeon]
MSILIKGCILNGKKKDVYIEDSTISEISDRITIEAESKIDASGLIAVTPFVNAHTHSAMTLFRGYADDMRLMDWLQNKIWPNEAKLTEKLVYHGAKLACLEMIKSGTAFFNDMYWHLPGTARAVKDTGMRACVSSVMIDMCDSEKSKAEIRKNAELYDKYSGYNDRMQFALGPHSIYTLSEESLRWAAEFSEKKNIRMHIHVSETEQEVKDCIKKNGLRPIEYLDKIGLLSSRTIAAHCVWLDEKEAGIIAKKGVNVVHNPIANMKLCVGNTFKHSMLKKSGANICLGTDGTASNNNLSMFDTMKTAALLQKHAENNPTILPATECLAMATENSYKCFGLNIGLNEGKMADIALLNGKEPSLVPCHNLSSNIVYAANSSCVDALICDGNILMQGRKVKDEESIIEEARQSVKELFE